VANGSGLALALGTVPGGSSSASPPEGVLDVMNVSDPTNTTAFLTRFVLPDLPRAEAIANGMAYVADGNGGLLVVTFQSFDIKNQAPTISISTDNTHALRDGTFRVKAQVSDDVQVRSVELLVNGQVVQT